MDNNRGVVLIVDDNPTNLDVLFDYLDKAGFEVFVAEDGESAIEQVQYIRPDIILLDVMMPGIDGFETCRRLKHEAITQDVPVMLITALTDAADKVKGFDAGAVDYVTKPLHHEEILARITTHLTIRNLQKDLQAQNKQLQQEITHRERIEKVLQEQTVDLKDRNQELDAFARTVSHNLQNPLTAIIGFAGLIQTTEAYLSKNGHQQLQTIIRNGYRMGNIMKELLLLARMRDSAVEMTPLKMLSIIQRSQDRLAYMIDEYQPQITIQTEWPVGIGYGPWIEEIWVNYLSNAIKYGGDPLYVELGGNSQNDGYARFWVRDNGAGLSKADQARLFTEFTRLEQTYTKGHGLGLSIVLRIIEKFGGEVGIESEIGQGSTFYFTLPEADRES